MKQSAKNASATAQNAFPKQHVPLAQFKATSSSTVLAFLRLAIMDFLEIRLRGFANLAPRTVLLVSKELTSARLAPIQGPNSLQKQGLAYHMIRVTAKQVYSTFMYPGQWYLSEETGTPNYTRGPSS